MTEQLHLDARQAAFVREFVAQGGGDPRPAMLKAGYDEAYAQREQNSLTRKPEVLAAIHIETARRVFALAPGSLETVKSIERGTITEGAKVRLDAAKTILAIAGHIAPRAKAQGDGQERTLSEMTLDELKEKQDQLQGEILARAKPVNAQPAAIPAPQALDLLGL